MSDQQTNIERVVRDLKDSVAPVAGDFDHPTYDEIEALVDGRLADAEREAISSHLELCEQCQQDVADLRVIQSTLQRAPVVARRTAWRTPAIAAAAIAASIVLAVWLGSRPAPSIDAPAVSVATPPTSAPIQPSETKSLLTSAEQTEIDRVLAGGRIVLPLAVRSLRGETGTLLGDADNRGLTPLTPVGTAILSPRPEFTWKAVAGALAYSVAVFDDQFREVARSPRITKTAWSPGADLPRTRALAWQITAHLDGRDLTGPAPPQPEARFLIMETGAADAVREQMVRLSGRPAELAILLAGAGLVLEAEHQLRRVDATPETAAARRLLADLTKR